MSEPAASGTHDSSDAHSLVERVHCTLGLEYSQFTVDFGENACVGLSWPDPLGLAMQSDFGRVVVAAVRQWGRVPVVVELFDTKPLLDSRWADVVEFSVTAEGPMTVDAWEPSSDGISVELAAGVDYRVRLVIVDGEAGALQYASDWHAEPLEEYVLQLWPQAVTAGAVVKNESPWAQGVVLGAAASDIVPVLSGVAAEHRATAILAPALERYPTIAQRIRNGEERYRLGLLGYLSGLKLATATDPDFAFLRDEPDAPRRILDAYFG